jgi:hypothetical protein
MLKLVIIAEQPVTDPPAGPYNHIGYIYYSAQLN